jgi:acyl-CoA synthetase (AMP-forming)/AMP-acid ligase II/acyl carrier protein
MLTGGDVLHRYPGQDLPFALVNNYGPTEATVVATSGVIPPAASANASPPIGRAVDHAEIFVLDEQMCPVAPGEAGEVWIGGAGVARGYRRRPELTRARFIISPFGSGRLYRSGDRARVSDDGTLQFVGRCDDQVKIRGFRIEPGEIAAVLDRHPAVRQAIIVAHGEEAAERRLIAYVALAPGSRPTRSELQEFLRRGLPEYMVPSLYVQLDALPLGTNGKISRSRLPAPTVANTITDPARVPLSGIERRLGQILASLLGMTEIGLDDNFFYLGGHSLLGTQLIVRIREEFRVELTLRTVFETPTVAGLSSNIERLLRQAAHT